MNRTTLDIVALIWVQDAPATVADTAMFAVSVPALESDMVATQTSGGQCQQKGLSWLLAEVRSIPTGPVCSKGVLTDQGIKNQSAVLIPGNPFGNGVSNVVEARGVEQKLLHRRSQAAEDLRRKQVERSLPRIALGVVCHRRGPGFASQHDGEPRRPTLRPGIQLIDSRCRQRLVHRHLRGHYAIAARCSGENSGARGWSTSGWKA